MECDGIYVSIHVKHPDVFQRKQKLYNDWLKKETLMIFYQILLDVHERFIPYQVEFPFLKLRNMTSRWGSCQPKQCTITLNKRLIEAPKNCIEYVVFHEL